MTVRVDAASRHIITRITLSTLSLPLALAFPTPVFTTYHTLSEQRPVVSHLSAKQHVGHVIASLGASPSPVTPQCNAVFSSYAFLPPSTRPSLFHTPSPRSAWSFLSTSRTGCINGRGEHPPLRPAPSSSPPPRRWSSPCLSACTTTSPCSSPPCSMYRRRYTRSLISCTLLHLPRSQRCRGGRQRKLPKSRSDSCGGIRSPHLARAVIRTMQCLTSSTAQCCSVQRFSEASSSAVRKARKQTA